MYFPRDVFSNIKRILHARLAQKVREWQTNSFALRTRCNNNSRKGMQTRN